MGHKTIVKSVRQSFYDALVTRGQVAQYIPLKQLEQWVESFGDANSITKVLNKEECKGCSHCGDSFVCFKYTADLDGEFPPHFHDRNELFIVSEGRLTMEYIEDGEYKKAELKAGDKLEVKANSLHRGSIHEHLVAYIKFPKESEPNES